MPKTHSLTTVPPGVQTTLVAIAKTHYPGHEIVSAAQRFFPYTQTTIIYGVLRTPTRNLIKVYLRTDGTPTSPQAMRLLERAARRKSFGLLGPRIFSKLVSVDGVPTHHEVIVGYHAPPAQKPMLAQDVTQADVDSALVAGRTKRSQVIASSRNEAIAWVIAFGGTVLRAYDRIPAIYASFDAQHLGRIATITEHPLIESVEAVVDRATIRPSGDFFPGSDDLEAMETYVNQNNGGGNTKVGIIECSSDCGIWYESAGGIVTPTAFSDWSGYTIQNGPGVHGCDQIADGQLCATGCTNTAGFCQGGKCMAHHTTMVASVVGASFSCTAPCVAQPSRLAYKTHIYFANFGQMEDRLSWLTQNNVKVIIESETPFHPDTVNYQIRNDWLSFSHAAGNDGGTTIPVNCYANALCVGAYSIAGSGSIDAWKSDPMNQNGNYGFRIDYRYGNGFHGTSSVADVEKPDVMGPHEIRALVPDGNWYMSSGSSIATPAIAGTWALAQQSWPFLQYWPELGRAVLMASAVSHNIEGVALSSAYGLDEIDGAGVPTAIAIERIRTKNWYKAFALTPSLFAFGPRYPAKNVVVQPGQGIRAVLGFMHCVNAPGSGFNGHFIAADFDLQAFEGTSLLDTGDSYHNSLESIEWINTTQSAVTVELKIRLWGSFGACQGLQREYAGLAWVIFDANTRQVIP